MFSQERIQFSGKLLGLLCMLAALIGCDRHEDGKPGVRDPVRVVVEPVQFSHQQLIVEAVGTSRALRTVTLHPVAAG